MRVKSIAKKVQQCEENSFFSLMQNSYVYKDMDREPRVKTLDSPLFTHVRHIFL